MRSKEGKKWEIAAEHIPQNWRAYFSSEQFQTLSWSQTYLHLYHHPFLFLIRNSKSQKNRTTLNLHFVTNFTCTEQSREPILHITGNQRLDPVDSHGIGDGDPPAGSKLHPSIQQTALELWRRGVVGVTKARGNLGLDHVPTPHLPPQVHA